MDSKSYSMNDHRIIYTLRRASNTCSNEHVYVISISLRKAIIELQSYCTLESHNKL